MLKSVLQINSVSTECSKFYVTIAAAAAAKLLRSCPTLCDPIDDSPPGAPSLGLTYVYMEGAAISTLCALVSK